MARPTSYKDAVLLAANSVGDSDSIACIVGGWMGAKLGEDAIPEDWRKRIENASGLADLADELAKKGL
jgi:ADP-ribosylglycohydrolase